MQTIPESCFLHVVYKEYVELFPNERSKYSFNLMTSTWGVIHPRRGKMPGSHSPYEIRFCHFGTSQTVQLSTICQILAIYESLLLEQLTIQKDWGIFSQPGV